MAEFIITGYKRLVEVRIVQHYFLDDGADDFQAPFNPNDSTQVRALKLQGREKRWNRYDLRPVLRIKPTAATDVLIKRLNGVFRQTATGFLVAVPPATVVPASARFDFVVTVEDSNFFQYTGLPFYKNSADKVFRNQKIVEIRHDGQVYRYKPNVFVFHNNQGTQATIRNPNGSVLQKRFFLTREIPDYDVAATYLTESLVKRNNDLFRAMRDKPNAPPSDQWQKINVSAVLTDPADASFTYARLPGYVTQNDIPDIVPPPGASGVPAKGILLTDDLPDDILALIQIETMPPLADFQLLNGGQLRTPHPVFDIHFKNRATYWRYFSKIQNKYTELPFSPPRGLTAFGNAMNTVNNGLTNPKKPYPVAIEVDTNATGDVLKMYANVSQLTDIV
jgi:hypothetical protein